MISQLGGVNEGVKLNTGLDPVILFLAFGFAVGVRKPIRASPPAIYEFLSTSLLPFLNFNAWVRKGIDLDRQSADGLAPDLLLTLIPDILLILLDCGLSIDLLAKAGVSYESTFYSYI